MMILLQFLKNMLTPVNNERGQGMVEYALLVALIAVVVIGVLIFLGPAVAAKFQEIIDAL